MPDEIELEPAIVAILQADIGVQSLTQIIVPSYSPQRNTYPQIVYKVTDTDEDKSYDGNTGLVKATLIVEAIDQDYSGARALGAKIKTALDDVAGSFGPTPTIVQGIFLNDQADDEFTDPSSEDLTLFVRRLIFEVWYEAA